MRVERTTQQFRPVNILIESEEELRLFSVLFDYVFNFDVAVSAGQNDFMEPEEIEELEHLVDIVNTRINEIRDRSSSAR